VVVTDTQFQPSEASLRRADEVRRRVRADMAELAAEALKWGTSRRYWTEFVFEGYVNHRPGAIFLKGLPDLPESRPHSREYIGDANGH
jgi:hypothetical protein